MKINNTVIGENYPTYIIAELSCNHNQNKKIAFQLIDEAYKAGANAIKLQTYTADTMTIKSDKSYFTDCWITRLHNIVLTKGGKDEQCNKK